MTSALQAASLRGGSAAELDFVPDRPIPAPVPKLRKARPGGVPWNRIVVGDALAEMRKISAADLFDIAIVDPPYNIGKDFGNNADRRDMPDYLRWTDEIIAEATRLAKPSAPVYVYGQSEILARVAARRPLEKQRWLVWHYTNKTVPRLNFWQRSHESILCLWKGARPKIRADAVREPYTEHYKKCAGKVRRETFCRYSSKGRRTIYNAHPNGALPRDVLKNPALAGGAGYSERWFLCRTCNGVFAPNELANHRAHDVLKHPTQKPGGLTERLLLSAVAPFSDGRVLIPFAGSGAECVAAKTLGADFFAAEINPEFAKLARGWLRANGFSKTLGTAGWVPVVR